MSEELEAIEDTYDHIQHFAVRDCYDQQFVKVSILASHRETRMAPVNSFKQLGTVHRRSKAPKGAIEDEFQELFSTILQQIASN